MLYLYVELFNPGLGGRVVECHAAQLVILIIQQLVELFVPALYVLLQLHTLEHFVYQKPPVTGGRFSLAVHTSTLHFAMCQACSLWDICNIKLAINMSTCFLQPCSCTAVTGATGFIKLN